MTITAINRLLQRDLALLSKEIGLYKEEQKIWITEQQIANSAGNLCLHLVGNLNGFIGTVIGNTGYIRERDREFSEKNVPRETLLRLVAGTATMIDAVLAKTTACLKRNTHCRYGLKKKPMVTSSFTWQGT